MSTTALHDALENRSTPTTGIPVLEQVQRRLELIRGVTADAIDAAANENRGLRASEERMVTKARKLIGDLEEREEELADDARRERLAAQSRVQTGQTGEQRSGGAHTSSQTYHRGPDSPSFFFDLFRARSGDADASDRLRSNNAESGREARALGSTGGVGGSGAEFSPPAYLISDYVALARPGRITADLFDVLPMPAGVSSIVIPKIATGTVVAPQTTQNTAVSDVDLTTNSLTSGIVTLAGSQVFSRQLMDQTPSGARFDEVVMEDLVGDLARQLGSQVISGTGAAGQLRGYLTPPSTSVITWTTTTPTATGLYGKLAQLQGLITSTRFRGPDVVVMHPRRWAAFASWVDSSGRPLVVPTAGGFNALATPDSVQGVGHVGSVLGMDVFTDASVPTNLGAGTNQDVILMFPRKDIKLWQSDIRAEVFEAPFAGSLGILARVFNYFSLIPDRYLASLGQVQGTGLVTPTFAA